MLPAPDESDSQYLGVCVVVFAYGKYKKEQQKYYSSRWITVR